MTENNPTEQALEQRLAEYGSVLRAHLDGVPASGQGVIGVVPIGTAAAVTVPKRRSMAKPAMAILSAAAAALVVVALAISGLGPDEAIESITVAADDVANQGGTAEVGDADKAVGLADDADADRAGPDGDGGRRRVATVESEITEGAAPSDADDPDKPVDQERSGEAAIDPDGDAQDDKSPGDGVQNASGKDVVEDDISHGETDGGCPEGALQRGAECYKIVAPSCGELSPAPSGDGCLQLVGPAGSSDGCQDPYELDGGQCVKLVEASATCTEGTPDGEWCVVKKPATGESSGCGSSQLELGGGCYELSAPASANCGTMVTLANGSCRYPVDGQSGATCPEGFAPLGADTCYRYEEPPTTTCAVGEPIANGTCKSTEAATPGPDICPEGTLEDGDGCYILFPTDSEGECGGYSPFEGQCRKDKAPISTWTCPDGKTVYENSCYVYSEAEVVCAVGEPVDGGAKCKTIVDALGTVGCPDYALQDGDGCYKEKPAELNCGALEAAPDGKNCKQWVGEATGGGDCPAGYSLVGSDCQTYVEAAVGCRDGELVYVAGAATCRYTTKPNATTSAGCASGHVEKSGDCYEVVAVSCNDLTPDVDTGGCKEPVSDS